MFVGRDQRAEKDFGASAPGAAIAARTAVRALTGRALTRRRPTPRELDSRLGHNRPFTVYEHELEPLHPRQVGRHHPSSRITPQPRGVLPSATKES